MMRYLVDSSRKRKRRCFFGRVRFRLVLIAFSLLIAERATPAAEIATNGVGGGAWTDPATWRGKKVPTADDDVVIQKNDIVIFDRGDGQPTCRKLQIDPKGGLTFKTGAGKLVLAVTDGIESFGAIRLDGTKSASDEFEIRLIGDAAKRVIKLGKGGALLLYGRANLPNDRRNVSLTAPPEKEQLPGLVECQGSVTIDWQRASIKDVKLYAINLDNTGAKANERLKLADNVCTGMARFYCQGCDTPEIVRNQFDNIGGKATGEAAISAHTCSLAEIKDNVIKGGFPTGIAVNVAVDNVVTGNTIEKCSIGIQGGYGVPNVMIRQATIKACDTGVKLEGASGVLENVTVEGAATAYYQTNCKLQLTGFRCKDLAKKGVAVEFDSGTLSLLNCELKPEDIKILPQKPDPAKPPPPEIVTCLHYVVVKATGAPKGALIEVRTAAPAPPAGTADPNVRNSPAALADGLTPLPKDVMPLMVKAWAYNPQGQFVKGPEYAIKLLGPAPKEGADRPVLKTQMFGPPPVTFRAEATDKTPTVEVKLP
jgi:hypothetical protein